ncbi:MAG: hypothetical protein FJ276_26030 [Planctomycetes bacterium]|nr:hypothetical protein [Planctomycetota bacterium]
MKRTLSALLACGLAMTATGCRICQSPYDDHYCAYGGAWQRSDPVSGRVGSILSGGGTYVPPAVDADTTPTEVDLYHAEGLDPPQAGY